MVSEPPTSAVPASDDDPLEALLVAVLERAETAGVGALEQACEAHPAHASGLRRRWKELERMGLLGDQPIPEIPERLGDFRLVRRLGGGGMGVVYLALQESLDREVALKLVRPEQMVLSGARERFLREVQIVARLQHPGIVPIYTFGKANGIAYFAMERVRGASLEQALAQLKGRASATLTGRDLGAAVVAAMDEQDRGAPLDESLYAGSWEQTVLRVFQRAAEALDHVHARGVLHRDLKPSNLMLTPDGRVMLLDFGLARGSGDARLTRSQAQLGSLHYYPPELLSGGPTHVDARSDVYSLGVSLYQCLCGRVPFDGPSAAATFAAIAQGAPPAPRGVNPALSWECETVCLTALETESGRRYASAALFARDLANVLEHRPIDARRPSAARRLRGWARRRPAAAVGLALGALLVVAGPLGWALKERQARDELERSFERSERHFTAALQAVGHVLRDTAVQELEDVPRMQKARLVAIDRALELFPELAHDRPDDARVWTERAALRTARGRVLRDLGQPEQALAEFELAIADQRALVARDPSAPNLRELANALHLKGKALSALARAPEGVAVFEECVALRRRVEALAADSAAGVSPSTARYDLAADLADQSEILRGVDRDADSVRALEEGLALVHALRSQSPQDAEIAWLEGRIEDDFSTVDNNDDRLEAALVHATTALASRRRANELAPERRMFAFDVAQSLWMLGRIQARLRKGEDADRNLGEAERLLGDLLRDFPDSSRYRDLIGYVLEARGMVHVYAGDVAAGIPHLERAVAERERLFDADPTRFDLALAAAQVSVNLTGAVNALGTDLQRVLEEAERSERLLGHCLAPQGPRGTAARMLDAVLHSKIVALCKLQRFEEARAQIERRAAGMAPSAWNQRLCADEWNEYFLALRGEKPVADARNEDERTAAEQVLAWLDKAVTAGYADVEELATTDALDSFRAEPAFAALLARAQAQGAKGEASK